MGFRFRKSKKLGKGARITFSKRGAGLSFGGKGLRLGVGSSGPRARATLPGTGVFYEKRFGTSKKAKQHSNDTAGSLSGQRQQAGSARKQAEAYRDAWEGWMEQLRTFHQADVEEVDWVGEAEALPPFTEEETGPNEAAARRRLEAYRPTIFDRLFRREHKKRAALKSELENAKQEDRALYEAWQEDVARAKRMVAGDPETMKAEIMSAGAAELLKNLKGRLDVQSIATDTAVLRLFLTDDEEVVPHVRYHVTKTGKLSEKNLTKTEYYALWRDYVLALAVLVMREAVAHTPLEKVVVHVQGPDADGSESTIFTVGVRRDLEYQLDQTHLPLTEIVEELPHRLNFLKTKGTRAVQPLEEEDV
ncbi:uncharacterized protein DUF4236 [Salsuginibacillus halophilus]|uniref:Uncharacterized protein DUF4236 n=1 Tax=Salsuginibacillus halophilus TaxID=517424 RepID=A0A2P8HBE1_9BACI|nr:DUF4236 domain-containing protein [Salsuginibacillus halophilus]PSL43537.1 uncharacterized protein DUF4236 [Salsuginibacillus halophilus]